MLSFELKPDILQKINELEEKLILANRLLEQQPDDVVAEIHRYARISMVGASTRIENAQLTDPEVSWLDTQLTEDGKVTAYDSQKAVIKDKLSKDRERSIEEVAGCRAMLIYIYQNAKELKPLRETDIRMLHHQLMEIHLKKSPYVGNYKIQPNSVVATNHSANSHRVVFQTADPGPITQTAMRDLLDWYNQNLAAHTNPIASASEFVFRFLAIHPFQDGNGRLGRGLFLLALLQSNNKSLQHITPCLAIDRQIEKHKEEYYFVLNRCSSGKFSADSKQYHIEYFLLYMLKILSKATDDIHHYLDKIKARNNLSESALSVMQCFNEYPEIRLTTKRIVEETQLPRRTVINALNRLLKFNLIQKYGLGASTRYQITF